MASVFSLDHAKGREGRGMAESMKSLGERTAHRSQSKQGPLAT